MLPVRLALPLPPTATFVPSDEVAIGALTALREDGRSVPRDMAIVGSDDISVACHLAPPLTTIHLPAYEQG